MPTRKNSPLVVYERISPNRTSPRPKPIKRLTPHCMAGNLSIERCMALPSFIAPNPTGGGTSCTYCIGSDGRIGLNVPETDAPWTSSSSVNDRQAITFEIANSGGAPNWPMTDAAVASFVKLAVDICKFYGFKGVIYKDKPSNIAVGDKPAVEEWIKTWEEEDKMTITLHRWFKAKACPGSYFISKLPEIVKEINSILNPPVVVKPTFTPYKIKIAVSALRVRKGPGTNYPIVMTLRNDPNIYTIVEEAKDANGHKWGKLKSGAGWLYLDYTKRV